MSRFSIILAILIIPLSVVSTDKSEIIANITRGLWISKKNLTTLLQITFDPLMCCNAAVFGDAGSIENAFNEFVKIYRYRYTLNSRTYDCTNYFMISTSPESLITAVRKIPTTMASIQLLLVVNDDIDESSGLFNISLYQNANVNIVARNSFWTLSEKFLEPRIFKEALGFHEMAQKKRFVDFQGRELRAATIYAPPVSYLRTPINQTHKGVEPKFYTAEDESELDGIEIQLFMLMAKRLNFTWKIREANFMHQSKYGRINGSAWSGGLLGLIYQKKVDIAFASIWSHSERYTVTNLTQQWSQIQVKFLVPKPKAYRSFLALITPFPKEVWAVILTMLIVQSTYVCTRAWIDSRIPRRFRNFPLTLTELMGQLLGMWTTSSIQGLQLNLHLWHLIGILLVTAYSSNLAASLASTTYENKIDTIREFIEANFTWGSQNTQELHLLFDDSDPYANEMRKRFNYERSDADRHRKILKGNYAILGRVMDSIFFPKDYVSDEDLKVNNINILQRLHLLINKIVVKGFRIMNEVTGSFFVTYCVQPWLVKPLDKILFQLRESGLVQYHITNVINRRAGRQLRELNNENDGKRGPQVLTITPLGVGFSTLILGLFLSTIVFFLERKFFTKKNQLSRYEQ